MGVNFAETITRIQLKIIKWKKNAGKDNSTTSKIQYLREAFRKGSWIGEYRINELK